MLVSIVVLYSILRYILINGRRLLKIPNKNSDSRLFICIFILQIRVQFPLIASWKTGFRSPVFLPEYVRICTHLYGKCCIKNLVRKENRDLLTPSHLCWVIVVIAGGGSLDAAAKGLCIFIKVGRLKHQSFRLTV